MQTSITRLPQSEAEINITLEPAEVERELRSAAGRLSAKNKIEGFRPGKAPYEVVKVRLGEMAIWNEAAEDIVRKNYAAALREQQLETIGPPEIAVKKLAPGNPIEFSAKAALLPAVTRLPTLSEISVIANNVTTGEKEIGAALAELQKMQTEEGEVERTAEKADKVTLDLTIERDRLPIEGGQVKNHSVYLSEPYYIPGFTEQLLGLKKGDSKTFTLKFPESHYQKALAGQPADFRVKILGVYELRPPALDDQFAKQLGQESLAALRDLVGKNLRQEAEQKERERQEIAALEELVKKSAFEEIPERLVESEAERMVSELEASLSQRGVEFTDYLHQISKTRPEVKLDFAPQATKRVKTILALRALAKRESLEVEESEVSRAVEEALNAHSGNAEAQSEIRSEEFSERARVALKNRKTIELLREKTVKGAR